MAAQQIQQLIKMANQIALKTGAQTHPESSEHKTAEHMRKFWTRAMREQLHGYWRAGGDGLEAVVTRALEQLAL